MRLSRAEGGIVVVVLGRCFALFGLSGATDAVPVVPAVPGVWETNDTSS